MKTSLLVGCILLYALSVTVEATKGGLSKDEQKKLLDALNKDRASVQAQEAYRGATFQQLTYDLELEKKAAAYDCKTASSSSGVIISALHWNSVGDEIYAELIKKKDIDVGLFDWRQTKIGCSKDITCKIKIEERHGLSDNLIGKELVTVGGCILGPLTTDLTGEEKLMASNLELPKHSKYGDLLGIKISSSGRAFNLIVFLVLPVFYF